MGKHRKSWSQQEKLTIVKFYKEHGAAKASKEFNVSPVNIYNWVELIKKGVSSSLSGANSSDKDKEILRLQREIQAYKEIIAEKELSLRIKDALLKKKSLSKQIRLEVANEFILAGCSVKTVLRFCFIARSSYYYKSTLGKSGRKPYAVFLNDKGRKIDAQQVIEALERLFEKPFVDYGYYKSYIYLRDDLGFKVSKHFVYKLMKVSGLLQSRYAISSKKGQRNWVQDLIPQTQIPLDYLEFDIKYVWLAGKRKSMQVLTVLDVNSRWNLGQYCAFSIKKEDVISLFETLFENYDLPKVVCIRSDNGSQFIANEVQEYFRDRQVKQEFTKPATPQQDAHIEAYHSIMESCICQRFEFNDLKEARKTLDEFRNFYNFERIHGGIDFQSPYKYLLQHQIDMKQVGQKKTKIGA